MLLSPGNRMVGGNLAFSCLHYVFFLELLSSDFAEHNRPFNGLDMAYILNSPIVAVFLLLGACKGATLAEFIV